MKTPISYKNFFNPEEFFFIFAYIKGEVIGMQDFYGREFLESEFNLMKNQLNSKLIDVVKGVENGVCNRCLNEEKNYLPTFSFNEKTITYCRKCLDFGFTSSETSLYRLSESPKIAKEVGELNINFKLSFLQERASSFTKKILATNDIGMIWAVCGAGKTEMMFESIRDALKSGKRVCWAIPRSDVVIDLAPRIKDAFLNAKVVTLHGNSTEKNDYGDIVVTTVHQMIRFYQAFDFLIIDEVDAFPYTFDEMLVRIAKRACKPVSATIYLSATPSRFDQNRIKKGTLKSCIIPARFHLYPLDVPKFVWCANFYDNVSKGKIPSPARRWITSKIKEERRALLFVPTIKCGLKFQAVLKNKMNLDVDFVYSSDADRLSKVANFKSGGPQFLITTMILERGVTIANIDVGIFACEHDIYEESALVQISGRVGRNPKWPTGEIIFFHHGITKAMLDAKEQIVGMNLSARKQNLLKEPNK